MLRILWILKFAIVLLIANRNIVNLGVLATAMSTVEKSFEVYKVVPDIISKAPATVATVQYPSGASVNEGNVLTPTQVKDKPTVKWNADPDQFYTLTMTDPDVISRTDQTIQEWHHWLVANVPGDKVAAGDLLYDYIGSGPPPGSDLHRYVFLVFKQPGKLTFDDPILSDKSLLNRNKFSISEFSKKYNLGEPVAGNFYRAEYDNYVPELYNKLKQKYKL